MFQNLEHVQRMQNIKWNACNCCVRYFSTCPHPRCISQKKIDIHSVPNLAILWDAPGSNLRDLRPGLQVADWSLTRKRHPEAQEKTQCVSVQQIKSLNYEYVDFGC